MMDNGFDPYDLLINLSERLNRLEHAHNKMAHAFQRTERDLNIALQSLRHLQQKHLELLQSKSINK